MNRPRILRWLRIRFSAVCLLVCVLLIVFWVRSFRLNEGIGWRVSSNRGFGMQSLLGCLSVATWKPTSERVWIFSEQLGDDKSKSKWSRGENAIGFAINHAQTNVEVIIPYWFCFLLTSAVAAAPWIRWRFSLRTLLIAVTLLSLGLGTLVYFSG